MLPFSANRLAAAIALIAVLGGGEASAQDVCAGLAARLASLDNGADGFGAEREIEAAMERQRDDLDRVMADARRSGCLSGLFSFRKPARNCGAIRQTVAKLRANLNRLNVQRRQGSFAPFAAARQRSKILRQLALNRCSEGYAADDDRLPRNVFGSLFEGERPRFDDWASDGFGTSGGLDLGTYRTLCVRTCDGYYFPISYATVPSKFGLDEQACRAACPGAEVALYSYRNPGEDVGTMMSLAGEPYSALPTAYKYRQAYDPACACKGAGAPNPGQESAGGSIITIGPPDPPAPAPEADVTAAKPAGTAASGGVAGPAKSEEKPEAPWVEGVGPDGRKVRIVGPKDFVAQ